MPLFLTPFLVLAAGNTRVHKIQADAALMDVQTRRAEYELHLAEFNAAHNRAFLIGATLSLPS